MQNWIALGLACPAVCLLATALVSSRQANASIVPFRRWVTRLAGLQLIVAVIAAIALVSGQIGPVLTASLGIEQSPLAFSIYYDGVSALMLALVGYVGWVICRYSIRYLDGEQSQGQYFRWTGFAIGAVSMLVVSGNLLMLMVFWIATSLGLNRLLLHYEDRPGARRAAWTKQIINRIGDAAMLIAIVLIYSQLQTLELRSIFAQLDLLSGDVSTSLHAAGWLLVVAAVTKSAQFPFHTWLPLTMETPTPVSALMHAGIVNAGGYLMIRTSPLVSLTPQSLTFLAVVGGLTACFGAVVMLSQNSIKKSLAYSTIAQMGFMMLQCGLGAYSAAMLHILAHSLYKAHAFLSSGSVMAERAAVRGAQPPSGQPDWTKALITCTVIAGMLAASFAIVGIDVNEKPGGLLLGGVLCMALTYWVSLSIHTRSHSLLTWSLIIAGGLCLTYAGCFAAIDSIVSSSLPEGTVNLGNWLVIALVGFGFVGMYLLQAMLSSTHPRRRWINVLYVHASNGFYLEKSHIQIARE